MPNYDLRAEQEFYDQARWGTVPDYLRATSTDIGRVIPPDTRTILDVGCGDGYITNRIGEGLRVIGLDLSPVALRTVRVPALVGSALDLPFPDAAFDLVMANDVVEHFVPEDRGRVLAEIERVAARYVLLTVPYAERLYRGFVFGPEGRDHVNRHRDSFDIAAMRGLLRRFTLKAAVFSGSEWDEEPGPIELMKRISGQQAADASAAEAVAQELTRLRKLHARHLCRHPETVDHRRRRTEIIGLFAKGEWSGLDTLTAASADYEAARKAGPRKGRLVISGTDFQTFRSPHAPFSSPHPYVCYAPANTVDEEGLHFSGAQPIDVKFGFFAGIEADASLRVELHMRAPGQVTLTRHDAARGYVRLGYHQLQAGSHRLLLALDGVQPSEHGHLFQLLSTAPLSLSHVGVEQRCQPMFATVPPGPSYLVRRLEDVLLFTSVAEPLRRVPDWFSMAEAFARNPGDIIENGAALELFAAEFATLAHEAQLAAAGRLDELERRIGELDTHVAALASRQDALQRAHRTLDTHVAALPSRQDALQRAHRTLDTRVAQIEVSIFHLRKLLDRARTIRRLLVRKGSDLGARIRGSLRRPLATAPLTSAPLAAPLLSPSGGLPARVTMLVADDRIDRRVLLEARTLAQRGSRVTVVAVPYPESVDRDRIEFPEVTIIRLDLGRAVAPALDFARTRLGPLPFDWTHVYFYTNHFLNAALQHPAELVIAHDLPVLPAAIAAADAFGARLVYDAHELYPEQEYFGEERMELFRQVEKELVPMADKVITVNKSIAIEMARRYGITEPAVILNAPAASGLTLPIPRSTVLRDAFAIPPEQRLFLYQGGLSVNRNLESLVRAMARVTSSSVLVMMGPGEEKREELKALARADGLLNSRIFFHDAVPQSTLLSYTVSADVGVIPYPGIDINTTFCTPNKLFEFLVAGLPILANDLPELRRFVVQQGAGITHPMTSPEEIARAIDLMSAADLEPYRAGAAIAGPKMLWSTQEDILIETCLAAMSARS